jgi:transposase
MLAADEHLRKEGVSELDRAKSFGMTVKQLRETKTIARNADRQHKISQVQRLRDKGLSNVAIEQKTGIPESTVRSLLADGVKDRTEVLTTQTNYLREEVNKQGAIDLGVGVENHLGISRQKLDAAIGVLKDEGYAYHLVQVDTGVAGQRTTMKVLAKPGTTYRELASDVSRIGHVTKYSDDGGRTMLGIIKPIGISAKRVGIRYDEDGGSEADGVLWVRPGVKDVALGGKNYAQVRVMVGKTHYLKGMAMYKEGLPPGVDIVFNTNKKKADSKSTLDAMKELKLKEDGEVDWDNPFGSYISRQIGEKGKSGQIEKLTSVMNLVNEEGDWGRWNKTLASQVLSKQSPVLAKRQLDLAYDRKKAQLDEIMAYNNPSVRKKLLEGFADEADRGALTLKAAGMKNQATHVILPINSLKDTEIYAPNYPPGQRVVLIRYPHGGKFEIPELVNNTNHPEAKKLLGNAPDAVGINSKVAERLSGADFDGDTVLVIPQTARGSLKSEPALQALKNFDPKRSYPAYDGMKTIDGGTYNAKTKKVEFPPGKKSSPRGKGQEMGNISNLITDMTIGGANNQELARAVKHSMVVIDAEKHALDWKHSYDQNGIAALKEQYQGRHPGGQLRGATTIISRAKSQTTTRKVQERPAREGGPIDPATGKKVYVPKGEPFLNKDGVLTTPTQKTTKLQKALDVDEDAFTITSGGSKKNPGTVIEGIYAEHSNRMRALANEARKNLVNTKTNARDPQAAKVYAKEVQSLKDQLDIALRNKPLERQARIIADTTVKLKTAQNPNMEKAELRKLNAMALNEARLRTGAKKKTIEITPDEWQAIQARAISPTMLKNILDNTDLETVKKFATPKYVPLMTSGKRSQAVAMAANGYTQAEIAAALGVSLTTLKTSLAGE